MTVFNPSLWHRLAVQLITTLVKKDKTIQTNLLTEHEDDHAWDTGS